MSAKMMTIRPFCRAIGPIALIACVNLAAHAFDPSDYTSALPRVRRLNGPVAEPPWVSPDDRSEQIWNVLLTTVADFDYQGQSLPEVLQDLRQRFDLNVHLDDSALELLGEKKAHDFVVHFSAHQITVGGALGEILRSNGLVSNALDFTVRNQSVVITDSEIAELNHEVRVYDVTDLASLPDPANPGWMMLDADALSDVISMTVVPDSWEEVAGAEGGSMQWLTADSRVLLVVKHTVRTQLMIDKLVTQLRHAAGLAQPTGRVSAASAQRRPVRSPRGRRQLERRWAAAPASVYPRVHSQ